MKSENIGSYKVLSPDGPVIELSEKGETYAPDNIINRNFI